MTTPSIVDIFAVPFSFARHAGPSRRNQALKRYGLQHEKTADGANLRPLTLRNYESHLNLLRVNDPAILELKAFCWKQLLTVIARLNGYDLPTLKRLNMFQRPLVSRHMPRWLFRIA